MESFDEVVELCFGDVARVGELLEFVLCHAGLCISLCEVSEVDLFIVWCEVWSECVKEVCKCLGAVVAEWYGRCLCREVVCGCVEGWAVWRVEGRVRRCRVR